MFGNEVILKMEILFWLNYMIIENRWLVIVDPFSDICVCRKKYSNEVKEQE